MLIIERFEGNIAIIENLDTGEFTETGKNLLPINSREGDVLERSGDCYIMNSEATAIRRKKIADRLKKMGL